MNTHKINSRRCAGCPHSNSKSGCTLEDLAPCVRSKPRTYFATKNFIQRLTAKAIGALKII